ncbi:hypothetical protein B5X24_HaOG214695 [Helicoverpa armigera]|nr:hypothetical protein B5X24_HaOG214695 [Helicoverpa armigera]
MTITRAASRRNVRPPPPESSLSSASPPPDPGPPVIPAAAAASSWSDEYFSPPTSPPPVRRQGRRRPPTGLGSGDHQVPSRVPATGGCVQRMRWTLRVNENVMRAYYGSTEGGTNLTAYRDRMLSLFQVLEPAVNVSAQRLSDQVRVIQCNHRLDDAALDRLRLRDAEQPYGHHLVTGCVPPPPSGRVTPRSNLVERDEDDRIVTISTQCNERLRSALEDAIQEFRYSPVENRPQLPRLPMHRQNKALSDQRWIYRSWEQPEQCVMDGSRPDDGATNMFWRNLWSTPVFHEEGDWTRDVERECEQIPEMEEDRTAQFLVKVAAKFDFLGSGRKINITDEKPSTSRSSKRNMEIVPSEPTTPLDNPNKILKKQENEHLLSLKIRKGKEMELRKAVLQLKSNLRKAKVQKLVFKERLTKTGCKSLWRVWRDHIAAKKYPSSPPFVTFP